MRKICETNTYCFQLLMFFKTVLNLGASSMSTSMGNTTSLASYSTPLLPNGNVSLGGMMQPVSSMNNSKFLVLAFFCCWTDPTQLNTNLFSPMNILATVKYILWIIMCGCVFRRVTEAATQRHLKMQLGSYLHPIILLGLYKSTTKPGQGCNHATGLQPASDVACRSCHVNIFWVFWPPFWNIAAGSS